METYDHAGGGFSRTILKFNSKAGSYPDFESVKAAVIAELQAEVDQYTKTIAVKDQKYVGIKALLKHMNECTEEDCEILHNQSFRRSQ